jgi:hypothetical protein
MADGRSVGWTIGNAIVPQHHGKAKGAVGVFIECLTYDNFVLKFLIADKISSFRLHERSLIDN